MLFSSYVVGPLGDNYGYYGPDLTDDDVDGARDVLDVEWVSDDVDDDTSSDDIDAQERDVDGKWLGAIPHVTSSITARPSKLVRIIATPVTYAVFTCLISLRMCNQ